MPTEQRPDLADDEVLAALEELVAILQDRSHAEQIGRRAAVIASERRAGKDFRAIVTQEQRPLAVELVARRIDDLVRASARFRRAQAVALRREGLTMDEIADLFGVTRQRVSTLLREARQAAEG